MRKAALFALTWLGHALRLGGARRWRASSSLRVVPAQSPAQGRMDGRHPQDVAGDDGEPRVQFNLHTGAGDSRWGFGVRLRDLAGLPSAAVDEMANDIQFAWSARPAPSASGFVRSGPRQRHLHIHAARPTSPTWPAPATRTSPATTCPVGAHRRHADHIRGIAKPDIQPPDRQCRAHADSSGHAGDRPRARRARLQGHRRRGARPDAHPRRDAGEHQGAAGPRQPRPVRRGPDQVPHPQGHPRVHQGDGSPGLQGPLYERRPRQDAIHKVSSKRSTS